MEFYAFVLCCTLFSSIAAFRVPDGVKELKNNIKLPSIVQKYDICENYCKNGGTCTVVEKKLVCSCSDDYSGERCQTYKCENYCENGGTCTVVEKKLVCSCSDDYSGEKCQTYKCENYCENGGTCTVVENKPVCSCSDEYSGEKCETYETCDKDRCKTSKCKCCDGYGLVKGSILTSDNCKKCNCGLKYNCTFSGSKKTCLCPVGYEDIKGICTIPKDACSPAVPHCEDTGGKCIFDQSQTAMCSCPDGTNYDKKVGCKVSEGTCEILYCEETGGICLPNRQFELECNCPEGTHYENDYGCKVPKDTCSAAVPHCEDTGGKCIFDQSQTAKCSCPTGTNYDKKVGCKVSEGTCEIEYCEETGGICLPNRQFKIECHCPEGADYEKDYGCKVSEISCQKLTYCTETGGKCKSLKTKGIHCECGDAIEYDKTLGCKVRENTCKEKKKHCLETGGFCKSEASGIQCICPSDMLYDENSGCQGLSIPRNLKATCYSNTSVCLKWDKPTVFMNPILYYEIHWLNSSSSGWERSFSNNTSHTMKHLVPFVIYSLRVAAVTKTGTGKMSENLDIRTAVGVPHAPTNLTVTKMTNKTAELKWNEPLISTGPIITYRVRWQNSSITGEEETRSAATFYTVRNLTPNVNYTFEVTALTAAGPGEWSRRVTGQTKLGDKCVLVKCQNDGNCEIKGEEAVCRCTERYNGKYCERDKCSNVTCQNGGKCIIKRSKAVCKCTDKYTGNFCETDLTSLDDPDDNIFISVFFKNRSLSADSKLDFHFSRKETSNRTITELLLRLNSVSVVRPPDDKCSLISCKNGGTCEVKNDKALCTCLDEYTGDHCEKSKCSLIKCQNNGKCQLKNGKALCSCSDNYSGEYCENHKCSLITCKNGGECEVKYGKTVCICPDNYAGDYCETDKCSLVGCKNGGKCFIINGKAICKCLDNYTGDLCETDKCSLIRCHNGGKCDIKNEKTVCVCKDKYIGEFCEIDKCSLIRCLNGGKCEIKNQKAVCICADEFTGDYCEKRIH